MRTYLSLPEPSGRALPLALIALCAFSQNAGFTQKDFEKLSPIVGTWLNKRTRGDIYETWTREGPTAFSGISYTLANGDTTPLEKVRLYREQNQIVYAPVAAGQNDEKQVLFRLKSMDGRRFVFENLKHDFPTRIVYDFRSSDSLYAHIEGKVQSKPRRVDYPYRRIH